jgi:predicted CopG family antitoxin
LAKSVRVHDDTHRVLTNLKASKRSRSIDQVIRELVKASTGKQIEDFGEAEGVNELTSYVEG